MSGPKMDEGFLRPGTVARRSGLRSRGACSRKGDLKYVRILDLLQDRPAHGYELIRALGGALPRLLLPESRLSLPDAPAARGHGLRERHPAGRHEGLLHHRRRPRSTEQAVRRGYLAGLTRWDSSLAARCARYGARKASAGCSAASCGFEADPEKAPRPGGDLQGRSGSRGHTRSRHARRGRAAC